MPESCNHVVSWGPFCLRCGVRVRFGYDGFVIDRCHEFHGGLAQACVAFCPNCGQHLAMITTSRHTQQDQATA